MLKTLLRFLSTPIHVHVPLPFISQRLFLRLDTFYDGAPYDGCTGKTAYLRFSVRDIGVLLLVDTPRYITLNAGVGVLGLALGTYKSYR